MEATPIYRPILNDKQAEMHALAELSESVRQGLVPLIDFRDPQPSGTRRAWSPRSAVADSVRSPSDGLIGCWGLDRPIAIDLRRVDEHRYDGDRHPVDDVLSMCGDMGIRAVPVTGRDRSHEYRDAVSTHVRRLGHGACVRLRDRDLTAGVDGTKGLIRDLDLPRSSIDLVFDLQQIDSTGTFMAAAVVGKCIERFVPLSDWRSVSIAASSFPQSLSETLGYNEYAIFPRAELSVWPQVRDLQEEKVNLGFGDYGILSATDSIPQFRGSANLRYAMDQSWYVMRGFHRDKAPPSDYARMAGDLVESQIWTGEEHCEGCAFLATKAEAGSGGNPKQYRQAGLTHHMTVTCLGW